MGTLTKYLFVALLSAALWNFGDRHVSPDPEDLAAEPLMEGIAVDTGISASDPGLCIPCQENFTSTNRIQSSAKRTNKVYRTTLEFIKSGKVINAGISFLVQKKSVVVHFSLMEPSHKLFYLGKLVI